MAEEGKKISFGFAKLVKQPILKTKISQEEKKVDYIECFDENNIKIIGEEKKKDNPLVIPLLGSRTWHDRILNKVDADIFEHKTVQGDKTNTKSSIQKEQLNLSNGNTSPKVTSIKTESTDDDENKIVTLEEQAAKEIIEDVKVKEEKGTKENEFTLPLIEDPLLKGHEESTIEDYERIPVDAFGVAMLRGMGWQPGKGIGKNEKVVSATIPEIRPKGMGLGADKVILQKKCTNPTKQEGNLKIEKGMFVRITAGKQSNNYGQIEGLDDDAGRLIVKLALGGDIISVNEFMVQPVTEAEYKRNSKVLNVKKYEEYKNKEPKDRSQVSSSHTKSISSDYSSESECDNKSNDSETERRRTRDRTVCEKSKKKHRHSKCDSDSDDYHKKTERCGKSISSSNDSSTSKKKKKSKKHRKHCYSPIRPHKKHKKRDEEKERTKNKKSMEADKQKNKKHGRSRSRSCNRR